jgi:hypothetical protein
MIRKLSGDHCRCSACHEHFNSTSAFDKHRAGDHRARRCLTGAEMRNKGMSISSQGWWLGSAWNGLAPQFRGSVGAAIGSHPHPGQGAEAFSARTTLPTTLLTPARP